MAAFNWIVFVDTCPHCGKTASIKAQCHVASTFDGDARGRFCNNTYQLNEDMIWWEKDDTRWSQWTVGGQLVSERAGSIDQCCYASCDKCQADIFAVVAFEPIKAVYVKQVGLEKDWPANYEK